MNKIYLDYAATTPVHPLVLRRFASSAKKYVANPNSGHNSGRAACAAIDKALVSMRRLLGLPYSYQLIPTSGSSESNNLAVKGVAFRNQDQGRHIITTAFEHSSTIASLNYLAKQGFEIAIAPNDEHGRIDVTKLEAMVRPDTILVSVCSINPEIGIHQPIDAIKRMLKRHPSTLFHVDATQSIGKEYLDLSCVDLISVTAHKFYGLKGVGLLIKHPRVHLVPLIHGGHSTTIDRRGTPATELILSMERALHLTIDHMDENIKYVKEINAYARSKIKDFPVVIINSTEDDLPHVLNLSIPGKKSRHTVEYFSVRHIEISNHTACESGDDLSVGVYALTGDRDRAESSIRLSFSHLTTKDEIDRFFDVMKEYLA